jgi:hypothetical protein
MDAYLQLADHCNCDHPSSSQQLNKRVYYSFRCDELPTEFLSGKRGIYRFSFFSVLKKYVVVVDLTDDEEVNFAKLKFADFLHITEHAQREIYTYDQILDREAVPSSLWTLIK